VRRVTEGSAAAQAGLQAGDVILGINGQGASSPHSVAQLIRQIQPGQAVAVQYWRNGQTNEMDILLQPVREYEVAFRGDGSMNGASRTGGDLESRTMRLEQQLATVMQELRQLRQEMMQMRGSSSGQTAVGGGGIGETSTTATGLDASTDASSATDAAATPPTTPPASTETPQNEPFGDAPATAAPESAAPAENDATPDPAPAATESDDDLFN
jgi:membrane-associated protease RseP (regulator of RpoE activity)